MSTIIFDENTRIYSVVDDQKEFGKLDNLANGVGSIAKAAVPAAAIAGAGAKIMNSFRGPQETFWGQFTGRNRQIRRREEAKNAEKLARINKGLDARSLLAKQLDRGHESKMAKLAQNPEMAKIKYGYKGKKIESKLNKDIAKINAGTDRTGMKYDYKGKVLDSGTDRLKLKYGYKGKKLDVGSDIMGMKYGYKGKKVDAKTDRKLAELGAGTDRTRALLDYGKVRSNNRLGRSVAHEEGLTSRKGIDSDSTRRYLAFQKGKTDRKAIGSNRLNKARAKYEYKLGEARARYNSPKDPSMINYMIARSENKTRRALGTGK